MGTPARKAIWQEVAAVGRTGGELTMVALQSLTSQRQRVVQQAAQLLQKLNETAKTVVGNLGGAPAKTDDDDPDP